MRFGQIWLRREVSEGESEKKDKGSDERRSSGRFEVTQEYIECSWIPRAGDEVSLIKHVISVENPTDTPFGGFLMYGIVIEGIDLGPEEQLGPKV